MCWKEFCRKNEKFQCIDAVLPGIAKSLGSRQFKRDQPWNLPHSIHTLHRTSPLLLLMSACIVRYQGTVQSHWMVGYELAADIAALHHVRVCIETDSHTSRLCTIQVLLLEGYCGPLCLILSPLDCCLLRRSWPDWLHSPESNITARETDLEDTMHSGSGTFHWQQLSGHASAVCLQLDFCIWHKHIL